MPVKSEKSSCCHYSTTADAVMSKLRERGLNFLKLNAMYSM